MQIGSAAGTEVLVTGANGLLGRATVARLAARGPVHALMRAAAERTLPEGASMLVHDLSERGDPPLMEIPETIVHLAQSSRYKDFPEGARDVFEVNVGSTQRLLDWASRNGVRRFVLASTGSVYGSGEAAFDEDAVIGDISGLGHYVASKRCAELVADAYRGRMVVVILRFFFIYGQWQRSSMLIPRLIDSVRNGRSIMLQGQDGLRINPIFVDDAAAAIEAATRLNTSETVNIAGPETLSLREIGMTIGKAVGRTPQFETQADKEPRHLIGDTSRMRRLLCAPSTNIWQGISQLIEADRVQAE